MLTLDEMILKAEQKLKAALDDFEEASRKLAVKMVDKRSSDQATQTLFDGTHLPVIVRSFVSNGEELLAQVQCGSMKSKEIVIFDWMVL